MDKELLTLADTCMMASKIISHCKLSADDKRKLKEVFDCLKAHASQYTPGVVTDEVREAMQIIRCLYKKISN